MREILFRGKRIDNGEWVYGYYARKGADEESFRHYICVSTFSSDCQSNYTYPFYLYDYEVDPSTVGQYTGLTDKNGKKVFEGDIIVIPPHVSRGKTYGIVEFGDYKNHPNGVDNTNLGFYIRWVSDNEIIEEMLRQDIVFWISYFHADVEVIGNIHDNPELLEV